MTTCTWLIVAMACVGQAPGSTGEAGGVSLMKTGLLDVGVEPGIGSKAFLLRIPRIRKELGIDKEQHERIQKAAEVGERMQETVFLERQAALRELRARGDSEGYHALQEVPLSNTFALTPLTDVPVVKALQPKQRTRIEQLLLQFDGPYAFMRPEIQERLNLGQDQVESIGRVVLEGRRRAAAAAMVPRDSIPIEKSMTREKRQALLDDPTARQRVEKVAKQVVDVRKATMQEIGKVLTKKQRAKFDAMLGEPFDFAKDPGSLSWNSLEPAPKSSLVPTKKQE